ncbi:MAG: kinesin-like protein Klp5 [Icmadophila ericetorum]|nr:kinesin-like protein Klp5 [Icmadophila ericetorum]
MADSSFLEERSSIKVCVRVRPFTLREAAQIAPAPEGPLFQGDGSLAAPAKATQKGIRSVIKVIDEKCLVFDPPEEFATKPKGFGPALGRRCKDQTFGFDRIFDDNTTQEDVFNETTKGLLDSVLDGYNATVFAYGATGCGKTHTISGTESDPGIIVRTMDELFKRIEECAHEKEINVSLQYMEIYNETIRDLFNPGSSKSGLMLREGDKKTQTVEGCTSFTPTSCDEVQELVKRGNANRTVSPTEANATSSRSHAVLQIDVRTRDLKTAVEKEEADHATLSIIDLAGSERASATKNRGERLTEGANINKSLLALGSCINALCDPRRRNHVPYRDSKLTRMLRHSLGGNCKTVMISCVSPSSQHFDETQNTLRYANRAKNIQTKVTKNRFDVNRHVKDYCSKIKEQLAIINDLKEQQNDYEKVAFAKFNKQTAKLEKAVEDGVKRIRSAYEHSSTERLEKASNMRKLRQIERRITLIASWVAAFDQICDAEEDEAALGNLTAMKNVAHGDLLELEQSRHHYHHRLKNSTWERAVDTALSVGLRELREAGGENNRFFAANLVREAELLKANAERDALNSVAELEKTSDASTTQVLLQGHFETVAAVRHLLSMGETDARAAARAILSKILTASTSATSFVVKPDGSMAPVEQFPPTRLGTPKRKKQATLIGPSPTKIPPMVVLSAVPQLNMTPVRASPKRRKLGGAKTKVTFTPKKTPTKGLKRGVRWRDDTEDGTLAEFEKTPKRLDATSDSGPHDPSPLTLADATTILPPQLNAELDGSSPILTPPEPTLDRKPTHSRFKAGFLTKKSDGSPHAPTLPNLSSDSDQSPLRELDMMKGNNRSSLQYVQNVSTDPGSRGGENHSGSDSDDQWKANKDDAMAINTAMKRASSVAPSSRDSLARQRRRSPPASKSSPPSESSMFTASHARRMVRNDKENDWSVLSPRSAPVVKAPVSRRITMSDGRSRELGTINREPVRLSTAVMGGGGSGNMRGSYAPGMKGSWK